MNRNYCIENQIIIFRGCLITTYPIVIISFLFSIYTTQSSSSSYTTNPFPFVSFSILPKISNSSEIFSFFFHNKRLNATLYLHDQKKISFSSSTFTSLFSLSLSLSFPFDLIFLDYVFFLLFEIKN